MSKGSGRRPGENYADNWDKIFSKKPVAVEEAPAQPEQEPDDNLLRLEFAEIPLHGYLRINSRRHDNGKFIYGVEEDYQAWRQWRLALAQPEQEPNQGTITIQEAWEACGGNPGIQATKSELVTTLKMLNEVCDEAQPKREWVGLTDDHLRELGFSTRPRWWAVLEAKLKELNA